MKNIKKIVRAVIIYTTGMVNIYAEVTHRDHDIELECGTNPISATWHTYKGKPGVQYILTTKGLRDADRKEEGIIEIRDVNSLGRTYYGLHAYIEARCCTSVYNENDISLTGSSLKCNKGEGIKVKMFEPNSANKDKYHYVGVLTEIIDKKNEASIQSTY